MSFEEKLKAMMNIDDEEQQKALKSFAAQVMGRAGGLKGGPARASWLSPEKRSEIAKKGADARWKKKTPTDI
jgi:hypothetical protein